MGCRFRARVLRVDGAVLAIHDVVVDPVLDVRCPVLDSPESFRVSLILGKQQFRRAFRDQPAPAVLRVLHLDHFGSLNSVCLG